MIPLGLKYFSYEFLQVSNSCTNPSGLKHFLGKFLQVPYNLSHLPFSVAPWISAWTATPLGTFT